MTAWYKRELDRLNDAYVTALSADITQLIRVVETWLEHPMMMVGSGGSYSAASMAAYLHERNTGKLARPATPLELLEGDAVSSGAACFSASGRNRDIGAAFTAAALNEMRPLSALVMADNTPLHELGKRFSYSDVVGVGSDMFKDGFLAVASLLASSVLLIRAYRLALGNSTPLPYSIEELTDWVTSLDCIRSFAEAAKALTNRDFVSVIYSSSLRPAAMDLESRFVEASLGALHTADLRNFGHGRHFWFATRSRNTGLVALIGDNQQRLADRTLQLLPDETEILRVDFSGPFDLQALAGFAVAFHLTEGAGRSAGVDPGKPGVPAFGRSLYRLGPNKRRRSQKILNQRAAITRKRAQDRLSSDMRDDIWSRAYFEALERYSMARFAGVVLDYDGTLSDPRHRYGPISEPVAAEIERLSSEGAFLGIATGRGPSAGNALRTRIPEAAWSNILIGYYNGAVIMDLANKTDPIVSILTDHPLLAALNKHALFEGKEIRANEKQISITLGISRSIQHAIETAASLIVASGTDARIIASSHSIDILLGAQSKLDVVRAVQNRSRSYGKPVLRIGDKGIWPGNDAELLDDVYGLTVDEASPHLEHCWGLAPAGILGVQAALYYLRNLRWKQGEGGQLTLSA